MTIVAGLFGLARGFFHRSGCLLCRLPASAFAQESRADHGRGLANLRHAEHPRDEREYSGHHCRDNHAHDDRDNAPSPREIAKECEEPPARHRRNCAGHEKARDRGNGAERIHLAHIHALAGEVATHVPHTFEPPDHKADRTCEGARSRGIARIDPEEDHGDREKREHRGRHAHHKGGARVLIGVEVARDEIRRGEGWQSQGVSDEHETVGARPNGGRATHDDPHDRCREHDEHNRREGHRDEQDPVHRGIGAIGPEVVAFVDPLRHAREDARHEGNGNDALWKHENGVRPVEGRESGEKLSVGAGSARLRLLHSRHGAARGPATCKHRDLADDHHRERPQPHRSELAQAEPAKTPLEPDLEADLPRPRPHEEGLRGTASHLGEGENEQHAPRPLRAIGLCPPEHEEQNRSRDIHEVVERRCPRERSEAFVRIEDLPEHDVDTREDHLRHHEVAENGRGLKRAWVKLGVRDDREERDGERAERRDPHRDNEEQREQARAEILALIRKLRRTHDCRHENRVEGATADEDPQGVWQNLRRRIRVCGDRCGAAEHHPEQEGAHEAQKTR